MPIGGFGNLIALPLQNTARKVGNSVFVDAEMRPHDDQWAFLSSLPRMTMAAVTDLVEVAEHSGRVLGGRMPVEDEQADEPWKMSPSCRTTPARLDVPIPQTIKVTAAVFWLVGGVFQRSGQSCPAAFAQFGRGSQSCV